MQTKNAVVARIIELARPIVTRKNLELVDACYEQENNQWYLRVFIERTGGIDLNEITEVSEELSMQMDQEPTDIFADVDFLEVSSPGAERPLKKEADYLQAIGNYIHLSLYSAIDNQKSYEGDLLKLDDDKLILAIRDKTRVIEKEFKRNNIAQARLAIKF